MSGAPWRVAVLAALVGCAGSLGDQLRDEPHGRFGPAVLAHRTPGGGPDAPRAAPVEAGAGPAATARWGADGPVAASELPRCVVPNDGLLSEAQAASWAPGPMLDREQARAAFIARSPAVLAAVQRFRASRTRYGQVEWLNDLVRRYDSFAQGGSLEPELSGPGMEPGAEVPGGAGMDAAMGTGMDSAMGAAPDASMGAGMTMGARPTWPLGGVGRMESAIADADVRLAGARLEAQVLEELATFEAAFQDALRWEREASVLGRDLRLADQVVAAAEAMNAGGRGSLADVLMGRMRRDDIAELRRTAEERAAAARVALGAALRLPTAALAAVALRGDDLPSLPPRDATRLQAADGPEARMAEAMAERATLMVQLVERQLLPELSLGTAFDRAGAVPRRSGDAQLATKAPFLAELRLMRSTEEASRDQARLAAPAMADQEWVMLSDGLRMFRLSSGPQRQRARQALAVATDAYRAGRAAFTDVSGALSSVLEVEILAERQRAEAFVAAARLQAVVGCAP